MSENLLFYDIEVFRYDSLVVFKNINGSIVASFWYNNDRDASQFPADEPNGFEGVLPLISGCTLVGYNNYNYDDIILTKMIRGAGADVIFATSNTIIQGGKTYTEIHPAIKSLDCMQQIDVGRPSLKQIEGNGGMSIKESSVPFDIQRPLTDEEKAELLLYCAHDITATIFTYKAREKSYFDVKKNLLTMLLPIALGITVRHFWSRAAALMERVLSRFAFPALMLLATIFFFQHQETIAENFVEVGACVAAFLIGAVLLAGGLSRIFQLSFQQRRTIVIEVGMQNAAQAIAVASSPFVFNDGRIAIPAIIYALLMNVVLLSYVGGLKWYDKKNPQ